MSLLMQKSRRKFLLHFSFAFLLLISACKVNPAVNTIQPTATTYQTATPNTTGVPAAPTGVPATEEEGSGLDIPTISIPGGSDWQQANSGGYESFTNEVTDVHHDAHDCVLNDISTSGMDISKVIASVTRDPNGETWQPYFTLVMHPPEDADAFVQWAIEIHNSLGIFIFNSFGEFDDSEFDSAPPEILMWQDMNTGEVGVDLMPPLSFATAIEASESLGPWFQDLSASIQTEAASGAVCDEFPG